MIRVEATPNPAVLVWARNSAAMSIEVAAARAALKVDQLRSWEVGSSRPSIALLRKLATVYRRPLAAFYLPDPPVTFPQLYDFRRLAGNQATAKESPSLALEIRRAHDRREWALELMEEISEVPPEFAATMTLGDDIEEAAERLRSAIGISSKDQSGWSTDYEAFKGWRLRIERSGILTFQATDLEMTEARGFSISERPLPAVVVNISDAPRGRIFTLMHETAHIMLNEGGICDLHDADTEAICNRVAGAALFPREDILRAPVVREHEGSDPTWSDDELRALSRQFGGSQEAALVRLLTLHLTTQSFYDRKRREFNRRYKQRPASEGFAPPHVVALSSAGPLFTSLVMENYGREHITASDVSDYLQIRVKHLPEIRTDFAWGT